MITFRSTGVSAASFLRREVSSLARLCNKGEPHTVVNYCLVPAFSPLHLVVNETGLEKWPTKRLISLTKKSV